MSFAVSCTEPVVAALALLSAAQHPTGISVVREMAAALDKVDRVVVRVQAEMASGEVNLAEVRASREPERYRVRLEPAKGRPEEYALWNPGRIAYTGADGKSVEEAQPDIRVIVNAASAYGYWAWEIFFDRARYVAADEAHVFYVHREEVEGRMCDLVGVIRQSPSGEPRTSIRYYWVDAATCLPRAFQINSVDRGRAVSGERMLLVDAAFPSGWPDDAFSSIPPVVRDAAETPPAVEEGSRKPKVGSAVPGLPIQTLELRPTTLPKLVRGGRTLVTFWAPWCGPCLSELRALREMPEVRSGRLRVVAIGCQASKGEIRRYASENKAPFVYAVDPAAERTTSELLGYFGVSGIPHAFLYDDKGKFAKSWLGFDDAKGLRRELGLL